jgi:hypothetical protein
MDKNQQSQERTTQVRDFPYLSQRISALWPPKSEKDELLLELYEQLLEKHTDLRRRTKS